MRDKNFPENEHMGKRGCKFKTLFRDSLPHFKKHFLQDAILKKNYTPWKIQLLQH